MAPAQGGFTGPRCNAGLRPIHTHPPMSLPSRPPSLDPVAAARWQTRPLSLQDTPWLHEEVAARMQERLDFITLQPRQWVHWEPLSGGVAAHKALLQRYPEALAWLACEHPPHAQAARPLLDRSWWQRLTGRGHRQQAGWPSGPSADMLWANMQLHTCPEPPALLRRWHQVLAVNGFLMFSCLGPDTLQELRRVHAQAGWPPPSHEFTDMHDWGDMLVEAGFAEPVMDMERITLTYSSPDSLLNELRGLGRNLHIHRFPGLRGRAWQQALNQALMSLARPEADGQLSVTFEIVYGHALKPQPRAKLAATTEIGLDQMRHMLRSSGGISDKV
jgi:malonyl-CoA O-methyltransferase